MVYVERTVEYVEAEMMDCRASQEDKPKCERCRCARWDYCSDDAKDSGEAGVLRCYGSPCGVFKMYERDDFDVIEPEACEDCARFDPSGLPFPMEVENVYVEQPRVGECLGSRNRIGSTVVVRPCNPAYGGKTYLGVLAGETPLQIGLHYDRDEKALTVYNGFTNPMIVVPSLSAVVYGCESWWKTIDSPDDFAEITDEEILSQPYMAALARVQADGR